MEKKRILFYRTKLFTPLILLSISLVIFSGCSTGKKKNIKIQNDEKAASQEMEQANTKDNKQSEQDEDLVSSPIDFKQLKTVHKKSENGISYYNFHSTKEMPLPLSEWGKLDIATEKGAIIPAYIRFTSFTRDTEKIAKHIKQYFKANNMKSTFRSQPEIAGDEYILMKYDIIIGKDTPLEKGDCILPLSVRFPIQLYSTMRSGNFGDTTAQERENLVMDVSVLDQDIPLAAGTAIEKAVLCSVPENYTAYGIMIPYLNTGGTTQALCFKLEY